MISYRKLFIIGFIAVLLLVVGFSFGANYYIDPDWGGTESGTYAQPWNSFASITQA